MNKLICTISVCLYCAMGVLTAQDLYDLDHIVEIKVAFSEPNWHEILDSLKERGDDERLVVDVVVDGEKYEKAGIRYKGNSSYFNVRNEGHPKLPFNIKVDFKKKKAKLPGGYTSLKLSNVFRDPSYLREALGYAIAAEYMPAPRANYARVYVNDELLGLYNLTQSVDDDLLERFYGEEDGTLIKCDPNWHMDRMSGCPASDKASLEYLGEDTICYRNYYELKSKKGSWKDLVKLTYILNKVPQRLPEILNIDETLWMLAFNNTVANLDSYTGHLGHNYYMYRDTFGIFHPILWDMNLCFGGFRYTGIGPPLSNEKMQTFSPLIHYKEQNHKRPLIVQLLSNDLYRKVYLAHIKTILEEQFLNDKYLEVAEKIRSTIRDEVSLDENRLYPLEDFDKNLHETVRMEKGSVIGLTELMKNRAIYLSEHPLLSHEAPAIEDVSHQAAADSVTISAQVGPAEKVYLYYRSQMHAPFKVQEMLATTTASDTDELTRWQVQLPVKEVMHYYLIAEDERSARLSPTRAAFEFYELVVK